ncbi:hypothetical protein SAY86_025759 [Trapa natans]|uniref:Uncharacterized protein n=1 Tax=Trapa natans TaxID=22666 RepID=A0AAN7KGQ4_TRANT|nr:hypothetical protein SAY86_025759 [Trapa natans]
MALNINLKNSSSTYDRSNSKKHRSSLRAEQQWLASFRTTTLAAPSDGAIGLGAQNRANKTA